MNAIPFLFRHRGLLRMLTFGSFIPALPLCLTHGILSDDAFPAVGLFPMLFSGVSGIFLHGHEKKRVKAVEEAVEATRNARPHERRGYIAEGIYEVDTLRGKLTHPFTVFLFDVTMFIIILGVLLYTWTKGSRSILWGMLAAYATIPLIVAFIAHATLAFRELYHGFAVHGMAKWIASKAADSHCPKCSHPVQPEMPDVPWFHMFKGWGKKRGDGVSAPLLTDGASDTSDITEEIIHGPQPIDIRSRLRDEGYGSIRHEEPTSTV